MWWVELGFVAWGSKALPEAPGSPGFLGALLYMYFVMQSFAVAWSLGLLVVFRETFNPKPGRVGGIVIGAAYGAYLVHPLFITLFAWALMRAPLAPHLLSVLTIAPPVVASTWAVATALKALPGAGHVL